MWAQPRSCFVRMVEGMTDEDEYEIIKVQDPVIENGMSGLTVGSLSPPLPRAVLPKDLAEWLTDSAASFFGPSPWSHIHNSADPDHNGSSRSAPSIPPPPPPPVLATNEILHNRFRVKKAIGSGGFGAIFLASDMRYKRQVAIKVEKTTSLSSSKSVDLYASTLHLEHYVMMMLQPPSVKGTIPGFPRNVFFGPIRPTDSTQRMLVMEMLGPSLYALFGLCDHRFSYTTILLITDQLLDRIATLHRKGILHRDIKPENILIGLNDAKTTIHLIDFGLSSIRSSPKGFHVSEEEKEGYYIGTYRYMSRRAHLCLKQTRKDDLESLVYTLGSFFVRGRLPWEKTKVTIPAPNKDPAEDELEETRKKSTASYSKDRFHEIVHQFKVEKWRLLFDTAPIEFAVFAENVFNLGLNEEPKYEEYKRMFRKLGKLLDVDYEAKKFDWSGFEQSPFLQANEIV